MNTVRFSLRILTLVMFALAFVVVTQAQATRTWVSGVGDDVNPCSRTAPCKTFAGAISKTAGGGEISVLDPGGYGALTITKSITVDGGTGAGWASVLASSTTGFIVNVSVNAATSVVILRNITINGASKCVTAGCAGLNGIRFLAGNHLYVENVVIENFSTSGITVSKTSAGALFVRNTDFDNVNTAISATTTVGPLFVYADTVKVQGNSNGIIYLAGASGSVVNSIFTRNIGGVNGCVSAASGSLVNVNRNHFTSNTLAINAAAGSTVRVSENEIFDNTTGLGGTAASFQSGANNKLAGNGASVAPTGPALTNQ